MRRDPTHPRVPHRYRILAPITLTAFFALACQTSAPGPVSTTAPPHSREVAGQEPNCEPAPATTSKGGAEFDPIDGLELDLTAFGAAIDALGGNGRVDITTEVDGRPDFRTVDVAQLGETLDAEEAPVLAVEAARPVSLGGPTSPGVGSLDRVASMKGGTADPLAPQQWSDKVTPYSPIWSCGRGEAVEIAIVDTGVDRLHPDLTGRATTGGTALDGASVVTPGTGGEDPHGHGTHVAGIAAATADNGIGIRGVAPAATIIPVRVLDAAGRGWNSDVAAGITWAVDQGAEVINLSLGGTYRSQAVTNAITYADAAGVVVVAAAGNGGAGAPRHFPGADERTVAVGSMDADKSVSRFSTTGDYVDVVAPGSGILSTAPDGGYQYMSGTSMASPFVSGVVALLIGNRGAMEPGSVLQQLTSSADDAGPSGFDPAYGHGIINPVRALST